MAAPGKNTESRYVALLRGVNVGGKHKLPMKDLAAIFVAAGCADVRTYIQSGNVVFAAKAPLAGRIGGIVSSAITKKFGFDAPVIVRSADEMRSIATRNPFLKKGCDPAFLHVVFLADEPGRAARAALDPGRSPPDEFVARGREIYLHLPNGAGRTKLTNLYFDSRLKTVSSSRNWNTVMALLEMTRP